MKGVVDAVNAGQVRAICILSETIDDDLLGIAVDIGEADAADEFFHQELDQWLRFSLDRWTSDRTDPPPRT